MFLYNSDITAYYSKVNSSTVVVEVVVVVEEVVVVEQLACSPITQEIGVRVPLESKSNATSG